MDPAHSKSPHSSSYASKTLGDTLRAIERHRETLRDTDPISLFSSSFFRVHFNRSVVVLAEVLIQRKAPDKFGQDHKRISTRKLFGCGIEWERSTGKSRTLNLKRMGLFRDSKSQNQNPSSAFLVYKGYNAYSQTTVK